MKHTNPVPPPHQHSSVCVDFLISALHKGCFISTTDTLKWLKEQNEKVSSDIKQIPLSQLSGWTNDGEKISHNSGKFFSIVGIRTQTNYGLVNSWDQPIIDQPEIGFLGIICKKINNVLHFLLQAKIEPGNINMVQLSPTLQATRSNYQRVHKGKAPLFLEYFTGQKEVKILIDQLQSEQGARFLHKRNRNIIIEVDENEPLPQGDNFIWLSLGQIKELLDFANVVNMDTRTVISCIQYGSYVEQNLDLLAVFNYLNKNSSNTMSSFLYSILSYENHLHDLSVIIQWIAALKFEYELQVSKIPLSKMSSWIYDDNVICHEQKKYFVVIGVEVNISNREVLSWDQPMIKTEQEGIVGFLVKKIGGIYHFLVQAKLEPGNFDIIELAPTVQCLTGNYRSGNNEYSVPYINEFLQADKSKIWYQSLQSEEGGRFYKEQNLNMIVEVDDNFPLEVGKNYCWMTMNQLMSFIVYNNYVNISARSLISAIRFY
jgi:oxidase EvaA